MCDSLSLIASAIRPIPDFPKKGIVFRDITTLLTSPQAFQAACDRMAEAARGLGATSIVAIESRGFLFGAPLAVALKLPLVIVRKPGKLPGKVVREEYTLEYGTDALEIQEDALKRGDRAVIIDDLLATGGTARAAALLTQKVGAQVSGWLFIVELLGLQGRKTLQEGFQQAQVVSLVSYKEE